MSLQKDQLDLRTNSKTKLKIHKNTLAQLEGEKIRTDKRSIPRLTTDLTASDGTKRCRTSERQHGRGELSESAASTVQRGTGAKRSSTWSTENCVRNSSIGC